MKSGQYQVEEAADYGAELAEGPLANPETGNVSALAIIDGQLHVYNTETGEMAEVYDHDGPIGAYTFQEDGSYLLFEEHGRIEQVSPDGEPVAAKRFDVDRWIDNGYEVRGNDAVAAPNGEVFFGVMPTEPDEHPGGGSLFRLSTDGAVSQVLDGIDIPNGMGFSPDERTLYFVESGEFTGEGQIRAFNYDPATGELSDERTLVDFSGTGTIPDGMTVSEDGDLFVALWSDGAIQQYDPHGNEATYIEVGTNKVSSVAFGGDGFDDLYASVPAMENEERFAGSLVRVEVPETGKPEHESSITL